MPYTRFVEIGRVCLITYGEESNKLCTVIDVVDTNRVLVDGPAPITGVTRRAINIKRLALTDFKVAVKRNAREKALKEAWEEAGVLAKWEASNWNKKITNKAKRAATTDFDRFVVRSLKRKIQA